MCTRHYTTCVGIPIFRHQSYGDKGRLIQKSCVCWDYVPEMGFATGKTMRASSHALQEKLTASGLNAQDCTFQKFVGFGHGQGFTVDTN